MPEQRPLRTATAVRGNNARRKGMRCIVGMGSERNLKSEHVEKETAYLIFMLRVKLPSSAKLCWQPIL